MSSILDALNKLEDEKEQARAQAELDPAEIDPAAAADELIGRKTISGSSTMTLSPMVLAGGAVAFLLFTVAVVVITVSFMMPNTPEPQPIAAIPTKASATPAPIEEPKPTPAPVEPAAAEPEPESTPEPEPVAAEPQPAPVTPAPEPQATIVQRAQPTVEPEPTRTTPVRPRPIVDNSLQPAARPVPEVTETQLPAQSENIQAFPPFTVELQRKHGLNEFKINMLNPESETNPYGSAIINRKKVFENSYIEGNQVRLYKVDRRGIALEVANTRKRYYLAF